MVTFMNKLIEVIGVGSPVMDRLGMVPESFINSLKGEKGGMLLIDDDEMNTLIGQVENDLSEAPGGSAANTVFALARLGIKTALLGKLGNDRTAQVYEERFRAWGGDNSRFKRGTTANARCLSLITPDSERTMRTHLGAAMTLTPEEISVNDFKNCQHAHIEGYLLFNRALLFKILDCAKIAGCTISLDLASFEVVQASSDILPDLITKFVDVVIANEEEARHFPKGKDSDDDYSKMAVELAKLARVGIVKMGKDGAWIASGKILHHIKSEAVDQVVDATAAGDLWAAGFLSGWLKGKSLPECGRRGSLFGAAVVQVIGSEIPEITWDALINKLDHY